MDFTLIHRIEIDQSVMELFAKLFQAAKTKEVISIEEVPAKTTTRSRSVKKEQGPEPEKSAILSPVKEEKGSASVTFEMIRDIVIAKKRDGHRDALLEILDQFGVQKVPDLKEEDYEAAFTAMKNIK